jgi:hypothetical protein
VNTKVPFPSSERRYRQILPRRHRRIQCAHKHVQQADSHRRCQEEADVNESGDGGVGVEPGARGSEDDNAYDAEDDD